MSKWFDDTKTTLSRSRERVNKTAMTVLELIKDDNLKPEYMNTLEQVMTENIKGEYSLQIFDNAIKLAKGDGAINHNGNVPLNVLEFQTECNKHLKDLQKKKNLQQVIENNPSYINFRKLVQNANNDNEPEDADDDVVATQQDINIIDPISKKIMTEPVRHKLCGHVYDRDSILQLMSRAKKRGIGTKCPAMGCSCLTYITEENLETALDVQREIFRHNQ